VIVGTAAPCSSSASHVAQGQALAAEQATVAKAAAVTAEALEAAHAQARAALASFALGGPDNG